MSWSKEDILEFDQVAPDLLAVSNVLSVSAKRGMGLSSLMVDLENSAWSKGYEILTNRIFIRKQPDGSLAKAFPPGVTPIKSLLGMVFHTSRILNEGKRNILVSIDGLQNTIDSWGWDAKEIEQFGLFLGTCRKYRHVWMFGTPDFQLLPAHIRDGRRDILSARLFIDFDQIRQLNEDISPGINLGERYGLKEIFFTDYNEQGNPPRKGILGRLEACRISSSPWNKSKMNLAPGDYIADNMAPSWMVRRGFLPANEKPFSFSMLLNLMSDKTSDEVPAALASWVKENKITSEAI